MTKIIVIGLLNDEDRFTLYMVAEWLRKNRPQYQELAADLLKRKNTDVYDMTTMPEKGDALDAIGAGTELVVALHLFGIDKLPGGSTEEATRRYPDFCYNRNNIELLKLCMKHGAVLVAVGDQPWLGMEKRTLMYGVDGVGPHTFESAEEPLIYLYESKRVQEVLNAG